MEALILAVAKQKPIANRAASSQLEITDDGEIHWRGVSIGRFYITLKGYPRFSSGPNRGRYVHRHLAAECLGRSLERSEDVHHNDYDKLNFAPHNLVVLDHKEHGFISALQSWYIRHYIEPQRRIHFDEVNGLDSYLDEETSCDLSFDIGAF